jgi:hypothetical protein
LNTPADATSGGGADVTQENLLVTLWTNPSGDATVPGTLIRPTSSLAASQAELALFGPGVYKQAFRSRLSARFAFTEDDPEEGPPWMLALLNPPPELKAAFLGNGPASDSGLGLNTGLSVFNLAAWDAASVDEEYVAQTTLFTFSGFSFIGDSLPFFKTNGADGVWPEIYPVGTLAEIEETLNALRNGAPFFIGVAIQPDQDNGLVTIRWPFSGAARG